MRGGWVALSGTVALSACVPRGGGSAGDWAWAMGFNALVVAVIGTYLATRNRPPASTTRTDKPRTISPASGLEEIDLRGEGELEETIRRQYRKKDTYYRLHMASGEALAVGFTEGEPWLDVIARKRRKGEKGGVYTGPFDHFGYDALDGRWSYGESPPGAGELRDLIARSFGAKRKGRWA